MCSERFNAEIPKQLFLIILFISYLLFPFSVIAQTVVDTTYVISISDWNEEIDSIITTQSVEIVNITESEGIVVANQSQYEFIISKDWTYEITKCRVRYF